MVNKRDGWWCCRSHNMANEGDSVGGIIGTVMWQKWGDNSCASPWHGKGSGMEVVRGECLNDRV